MMRGIGYLVVALSTLLVAFGAYRFGQRQDPSPSFSGGPTVEKLEELGALVSTRVHVADILAGKYNGHWRGSWLIKGDALLVVDMRKAVIASKDDASRQASISLPPPRVMQPRVDHEKTLTYSVEKTTWIPGLFLPVDQSDRLRDAAMRHAQSLVEKVAGSKEHIDEARIATATLIKGFYQLVGWNVEVRWMDDRSAD